MHFVMQHIMQLYIETLARKHWNAHTFPSLSLSDIASLLINHFFQICIQSIYSTNYQKNIGHTVITCASSYLKGCLKSIILYCLQRKLKCHKFSVKDIIVLDGRNFEIHEAGTEKKNTLHFQKPECICKDWVGNQIPCKLSFAEFQTGIG